MFYFLVLIALAVGVLLGYFVLPTIIRGWRVVEKRCNHCGKTAICAPCEHGVICDACSAKGKS